MSNLLDVRNNVHDPDSYSETSSDQFDEDMYFLRSASPTAVERLGTGLKQWSALVLWTFCLLSQFLNALRVSLPSPFGISLLTMSRSCIFTVIVYIVVRIGLFSVLKWLRKADSDRIVDGTLEKATTDLASYLEAIMDPLSFLLTTVIFSAAWYSVYPMDCGETLIGSSTPIVEEAMNIGNAVPVVDEDTAAVRSALNSLSSMPQTGKLSLLLAEALSKFCSFQFITDLILCSIVINIVLIIERIFLRMGLWKFLRGNFKERIIEARYRTYVVEAIRAKCSNVLSNGQEQQYRLSIIEFPFALPFRTFVFDRLLDWINQGLLDVGPKSFDQIIQHRPLHYNEYRRKFNSWLQRHGIDQAVDFVARTVPQNDVGSKALAKELFTYLCPSDRQFVVADDFAKIFQGRAATRDAYCIFDRDQDGTVSKTEFRHTCISVYREIRNLAASVNDAALAFTSLADIIHWLVLAGLVFTTMVIFGAQVQSIFAIILSLVLGLNVIIGDVAKKAFQGVIFLFVDHPYDIGDRILTSAVNGNDPLIVCQINMLTTILHRWNGQEIYVSNASLAGSTIYNISRSSEQWERIDFQIAIDDKLSTESKSTTDKLGVFRDKLEAFLKSNAADYIAAYELKPLIAGEHGKSEEYLDVMEMTLRVQCRPTVDSQKRWNRHSKLLHFLNSALKASGLELQGKLKCVK